MDWEDWLFVIIITTVIGGIISLGIIVSINDNNEAKEFCEDKNMVYGMKPTIEFADPKGCYEVENDTLTNFYEIHKSQGKYYFKEMRG